MFELKVQYLSEQNFALRRQVVGLKGVLSVGSEENEQSLLYQLREANERLELRLQGVQDELLLERQAREIESVDHSQTVQLLNRCIYELKEQIAVLEEIVRQEKKCEYQPNAIEKWFKNKLINEQNDLYHTYSHPVIYHEVMQGLIAALEHSTMELESESGDDWDNKQLMQTGDPQSPGHSEIVLKEEKIYKIKEFSRVSEVPIMEQSDICLNESKGKGPLCRTEQNQFSERKNETSEGHSWLKDKSSIYFLKKKQIKDLHLDMQKAKYVQMQCLKVQDQQQPPSSVLQTNVPLLKKSYIELIGAYQILKKKIRGHERYIQQLQMRNELLLKGRICAITQ